ncbi:amino acid adenylation domain-containing protein [Nocardia cyriacigeorgica]|uniref:Amino acid adenylation domain-containing protein n=1 Tax=Nocardia cyriacigeorgica TaxID=135487 RepID=A0ABX0CS12_9NOCA|nr:non-ribosomal peptide synthetase [Nocardia cyriacigeorgica]NEW56597.1 amino acid adenylation domain-containing protein [Nocardia cyriacigeorgica]
MISETTPAEAEEPGLPRWPVTAYQRDVLSAAFRFAPEPVSQLAVQGDVDRPLDVARMREVLHRAVRRNDALRLRFELVDGEFLQWVSETEPVLEHVDFTGEPDPADACARWMRAASAQPIVGDGNLAVAVLVDDPADFHIFIRVLHANADGWALNMLLAHLILDFLSGDGQEFTQPLPSYQELLTAEREYRFSAEWNADRDALLEHVGDAIPALFTRTAAPTAARGHRVVRLDKQYLDRLRATGTSSFAYSAAALGAYLCAVHRTDEVMLGVPMLNRDTPVAIAAGGHVTNMLPVRVRVGGERTLADVATDVAAQIKALKKRQRFAYGDLMRALAEDPSAPPLFDVSYSYMRLPASDHLDQIMERLRLPNAGSCLQALNIVAIEHQRDGSLSMQLIYDLDVFDAAYPIGSAIDSVATMIEASLADPTQPVSALPLLAPRAAHRVAEFEAGPRAEFPYTTLDRLFAEQAAAHPARAAVIAADGTRLGYAELAERADGFADRLLELGATGNECVPVVLPRSPEMLIAMYGILRAGCAYVPLDTEFPATRIETVLADCGARFVVAGPEHQAVFDRLGVIRVHPGQARPVKVENRSHPADLAYLIYTSGSTGKPKGVMIEHRSVVNRLNWMQRRYPLGVQDVILQKTPATFDVSVWELFWWAITGARVALLEAGGERDPRRIIAAIDNDAVTVLHFVPSMLAAFVDELESDRAAVDRVATLRRVFCSGEALPPALVRRFHALFTAAGVTAPRLVNLYGPTEATVDVSYFDCPDDEPLDVVPIGRSIENIDLLVLDEHGRRLPPGVPGELNIAGVGVARGYRGRDELTAASFVHDLTVSGRRRYRTGDLVRWLPDGQIEYLGRFDDQVKVRGNRVTLGEVQNAMLDCAGVRAAAVVDEKSTTHGVYLVGYYVGESGTEPTTDRLAAELGTRLPKYMVPTRLVRVERIPVTRNGKLDRRALAQAAAEHQPVGHTAGSGEPRNEVEAALVRVWSATLGVDSIGVHDNFFTHGGDSILALSVRTAAERAGLRFDVDTFYQRPTIAELAEVIADGAERAPEPITAPLATVPLVDHAALHRAEDAFPATALQLGMLFHSLERADSVTYKDVFRYRLRIPWQERQFRTAFDRLLRRQPALRSSFEMTKFSVPLQIVHPEIDPDYAVVDLTTIAEAAAERQVEDYIQERRHARFAIDQAPLHALRVFLRAPEPATDTVAVDLVLSFHHAILDGWSVATSVLELLRDYLHALGVLDTGIDDTAHPAAALAEYAQAELIATQRESSRTYWREALAGAEATALTALAAHQPQRHAPARARALVPRRLTARIADFAARHQVPEKSVYLSAHLLALRLLSGRGDVTTGVVSHGRPDRAGAESLAGLFLNTLPMRLNATVTTWRDAVDQVVRRDRDAYPHRRYPLRSIMADHGGPVFETAFNYVNYHQFQTILGTDRVRLDDIDIREETNFQLLVTAATDPRDGRMWLRVDGDGAIGAQQCETLALTELRMLAALVDNPDAAVDPGANWVSGRDVGSLVAEVAAVRPHEIAIASDDAVWTYDELVTRSDVIAARLLAQGVRAGSKVAIIGRSTPRLVALVLAVARIGAASVPLDVRYPRARLNLMIERARPHRVVVDAEHLDLVDDPALVLDSAELTAPAGPSDAPAPRFAPVHPETTAYVLFTSGSTGEPKGVAMPHRGLTALVDWQLRADSGAGLASTLQAAPLSFDVAFQEIFTTLAAGSTLRVSERDLRADMDDLLGTVADEEIERVFLPYVALQAFAEAASVRQIYPTALKVLASSGEQLRITDEIRALRAAIPGLLLENQYGPTETHVATTYTLTGPESAFPVLPPIGRTVDGDTADLLDRRLRTVPDGVVGELYIGGRSLARGYEAMPGLTAQRFVAAPGGAIRYRTGDLGVRLRSGDIVCLGRSDSQVKIRGYRVEPAEVELSILGLVEHFPGLTEAAVVARGFGGIDGALVAFLVGDAESTDLTALRAALRSVLPAHMVPSRFQWVESMPRTPSGKRDDRALLALPVVGVVDQAQPNRGPVDDIERSAMELLAEYAGLPSMGPDDDFYAMGGTSIGAMRVVMGLSRRWGIDLPMSAFVAAPTAAGLAELIRAGDTHTSFDPLVPIQPEGTKPPLFLVHPIGGNVLCYLAVAKYLDSDRPVYGLQSAGADTGSTPLTSVGEMADSYIAAVRRVHPEGPYHLAGWSFGGYVALEMGRRLPDHEVASVTLLDTMALRRQSREPIPEEKLIRWFFLELLWYARGNESALGEFEPDVHDSAELFDAMLAEAIRSGILPEGSPAQSIRRLYEVFHANYTALIEYEPSVFDRDITLLRATDGIPRGFDIAHQTIGTMFDSQNNGWEQYAGRRFEVVAVPGDHLHMMTEPHVGEVGMQLDAAVSAADPDLDREFSEGMLDV